MVYVLLISGVFVGFVCGYVYRWRGVPFLGKWGVPFVGRKSKFAIGIYTGSSLGDLAESSAIKNPVLSTEMVTDVRASTLADPFLFKHDEKWYMFMEVLNRSRRCGEIGFATSEGGLNWSYQAIVLRESFHLSYPFVFEHRGEIWMIPETCRDNSVRLYRATGFPRQWKFEKRLIEGLRYSDASVFQYDGSWWMFVSRNKSEDLLLYYADELTGPWQPHPQSPVVYAKPALARCARRPVYLNGKFVRFAQDCEGDYGRAVRAFRINRLNREEYQESELEESPILCPTEHGWNAKGMHHIDLHSEADGSYLAAVDGWRMVRDVGLKY